MADNSRDEDRYGSWDSQRGRGRDRDDDTWRGSNDRSRDETRGDYRGGMTGQNRTSGYGAGYGGQTYGDTYRGQTASGRDYESGYGQRERDYGRQGYGQSAYEAGYGQSGYGQHRDSDHGYGQGGRGWDRGQSGSSGSSYDQGRGYGSGGYGQDRQLSQYGQGGYNQDRFGQGSYGGAYGQGGRQNYGQTYGQSFGNRSAGGQSRFGQQQDDDYAWGAGGMGMTSGYRSSGSMQGSQYGAYGSGYGAYGNYDQQNDRGFFDKAGDEVASWFGSERAQQRRQMDHVQDHSGRGPKGYKRSDDRIKEDVNDRLTHDPMVDASSIEVEVKDGEVTLSGTVENRSDKRRAEDCAENVMGVSHVQNNIRVQPQSMTNSGSGTGSGTTTYGATKGASSATGSTGSMGSGSSTETSKKST